MRVLLRYIRSRSLALSYAFSSGSALSHPVDRRAAETAHDPVRYLVFVAATIFLVAAGFVGILWGLDITGRKPPPAFTNSQCFDAKLEFLRENPPIEPTHLIVGSSIAWRNLAADVVVKRHPDARPLNGAFCGLSLNQSTFTARFLLQRFPTITDVLLVVDPFDMGACRSHKTNLFDPADVSAYLSGADDLQFYFKYFDIFSLLVNAFGTRDVYTRYGDGPLKTDQSFGLVYGPAPAVQPACRTALAEFAQDMEKSGKRLVVVTMPLLTDWSDKYDRDSKAKKHLANQVRRTLDGKSAQFWDGWSEITLPAKDYTDAVHLRWSAVPAFTRRLIEATGFGSRQG